MRFHHDSAKTCVAFLLMLLIAGCSLALGCRERDVANVQSPAEVAAPQKTLRIITTAPSITETVFALGLQDSVVAVSDYCKYPEKAKSLPKIGSLYDYNVERIIELDPDVVIVLKENETLPARLKSLGVETIAVDHASLEGVLASFEELGALAERVDSEKYAQTLERGRALREDTETRVEAVRERVKNLPKTRVMISIYRALGTGAVTEAYVAGNNPYFNTILEIAGGENVGKDLTGVAPILDAEGIIALNPEVIFDLSTDGVERDAETIARETEIRVADWQSLGRDVDAVKNGRIYQVFDDYATMPGPRAILFIERLAETLHPTSKSNEENASN